MLPATSLERSTTRMPSSGAGAVGSNSIRGIMVSLGVTSLGRAILASQSGYLQGLAAVGPIGWPSSARAYTAVALNDRGIRALSQPGRDRLGAVCQAGARVKFGAGGGS